MAKDKGQKHSSARLASVTLFRSVCDAEAESTLRSGRFSSVSGSLEVKWFAESAEHAKLWGKWFERSSGITHKRILAAQLDGRTASTLIRLQNLDGIGPARCATLSQLKRAKITEYSA